MNIKIIDEKEQFAQCETFEITHLLWGNKSNSKNIWKNCLLERAWISGGNDL